MGGSPCHQIAGITDALLVRACRLREDRVGQRRRRYDGTGLADATRRFSTLHHVHLNHGRLTDAKHSVVVKIALLDTAILDGDFIEKSGCEAEQYPALYLRLHRVRVDDQATLHNAHQRLWSTSPSFVISTLVTSAKQLPKTSYDVDNTGAAVFGAGKTCRTSNFPEHG